MPKTIDFSRSCFLNCWWVECKVCISLSRFRLTCEQICETVRACFLINSNKSKKQCCYLLLPKLTNWRIPGSELRAQALRTPHRVPFGISQGVGGAHNILCGVRSAHGSSRRTRRRRARSYQKRLWLVVCVINCWAARTPTCLNTYSRCEGGKAATNIARGKINWEFTRL